MMRENIFWGEKILMMEREGQRGGDQDLNRRISGTDNSKWREEMKAILRENGIKWGKVLYDVYKSDVCLSIYSLPVLDLSDSDSDSLSLTDYEFAIDAAGYGSFHWWLLFVCGWANASDAVEILCISFLLPSAECDLQLSSADKGWLSGIMFVGKRK